MRFDQFEGGAAFQIKATRGLTAKAKGEHGSRINHANGADHALGDRTFSILIGDLQHKMVWIAKGSSESVLFDGSHF